MNVLIAGGLGYVGGRIASQLAGRDGFQVVVTTRDPARRRRPFSQGEIVATADALQPAALARRKIDAVIHLATPTETLSNRSPLAALQANASVTLPLLEAARAGGVRHFIYISTVHVYGTPLKGRIDETSCPAPVQPYAIIHRTAEDFALSAAGKDFRVTVLRLANAVGAPIDTAVDRWSLLANDLCREAALRRRLVLRSSGRQWRNFLPLSDVGRAAEHLLQTPAPSGVYNLAGERSCRVAEVVDLVAERCDALWNFRPEIQWPIKPPVEDESPLELVVDRLRETGFSFEGALAQAIDETLLFCRQHAAEL